MSPNVDNKTYRSKVEALEDAVRVTGGNVIVAGDFNAKDVDRGMGWTNSRGNSILQIAERLDLTSLNTGTTTTFRKAGTKGSIIDLSFVSSVLASRIADWRVLEDFSGSDHILRS